MAASAPSTFTGGWSTCEDWSWCCASASAVSRASSASSFPRRAFWFASTLASESRSVAISASSPWRVSPPPPRSPARRPRLHPPARAPQPLAPRLVIAGATLPAGQLLLQRGQLAAAALELGLGAPQPLLDLRPPRVQP